LSTALFDKPPFQNVIVNGMVLAEDGSKMSKSKQNYPPPDKVFDAYGADALRAYLINSPIVRAEPIRFSEAGVREVVRTVLLPLRNAWSFFVQYANIDGWTPEDGVRGVGAPPVSERPELDRWILSVLQSLVKEVNSQMEGYYLYRVIPPTLGFIDHLTNWYIRSSRRRFWRTADDESGLQDKASAYATLYEVLEVFSKVIAPMLPFVSESIYQNLVAEPGGEPGDSVHLCDYPQVDESRIDQGLEARVAHTRQVVRLGRALRERHRLRTRQPLAQVVVVHHDADFCAAIREQGTVIADELNVKEVDVRDEDSTLATLRFKANYKTLGRRYGKQMREAAAAIAELSLEQWQTLRDGGAIEVVGQPITAEDVDVRREPRGDVVIETDGALTVALDTRLTEALVGEGLTREVTSRVQRLRKETGLEVTDRIRLTLSTDVDALRQALEAHRQHVADEVLALVLVVQGGSSGDHQMEVEGHPIGISLERV
jgi:isoleucyl-tRNA synthetase